jgi:hypothetical protein
MALVMLKEIVVSLAELRQVCIECIHCKTAVTLDLLDETGNITKGGDTFAPQACPGCGNEYDSAIPRNLNALQKACKTMEPVANRVKFRIDATNVRPV